MVVIHHIGRLEGLAPKFASEILVEAPNFASITNTPNIAF